MSDRLFRLLFGLILISALYFKLETLVMALIAVLVFEALSNRLLLKLLGKLFKGAFGPTDMPISTPEPKYKFRAEQGLRIIMAAVLILGVTFPEIAWFLPWLVGLALVAAGLSGICPVFLLLKWARLS